jgi:hypothetical protein
MIRKGEEFPSGLGMAVPDADTPVFLYSLPSLLECVDQTGNLVGAEGAGEGVLG